MSPKVGCGDGLVKAESGPANAVHYGISAQSLPEPGPTQDRFHHREDPVNPLTPRFLIVSASSTLLATGTAAAQTTNLDILADVGGTEYRVTTSAADRDTAWYVVTEDNAALRCGARDRGFYKVAELPAGTWLEVDTDVPGITPGWLRAAYPDWVYPYVKPEAVRAIDERTLEVIRPAKVLQPNLLVGAAGSWRSMFSEDLPVGTRLRITETLRLEDGSVASYRVEVPAPPPGADPARAFIKASSVREATAEEVAEWLAAQDPVAQPDEPAAEQPAEADDESTTEAPVEQPVAADSDAGPVDGEESAQADDTAAPAPVIDLEDLEPEEAPAQDATPAADNTAPADATTDSADASLLDDMVEDVDLSTVGTPAPPVDTPSADEPAEPAQPEAAAPTPVVDPTPAYLSVAELDREFNSLRRLRGPESRPAIEELIGEYQRTRGSTGSARIQQAIDQRIDILNLRLSILDAAAEAEAALEASRQRQSTLAQDLTRWRSNRQYTLVGRLVPSLLYDGERLPLMYRMESIGAGPGPRTLGYVRPDVDGVRPGVLGEVVGVIGDSRYDDGLNLLIVTPSRIDVLQPTDTGRP